MLTKEYLKKIGFEQSDIDVIIIYNEKYERELEPIVKAYIAGINPEVFSPYAQGEREKSHKRAISFGRAVQEKFPDANGNLIRLIAWLNCVPHLEKIYTDNGLSHELFFEAMKDFTYKVRECKAVYGVCGVYTDWFFLFFELKLFSLGRLQYEVSSFEYDEYCCGDIRIKKGDRVYSCHIPSCGRLTSELCIDSFQRAYDFFKPHIDGDVIPIVCHTWLFYKAYLDDVFEPGSNIERFAKLFDIIDVTSFGDNFDNCRNIFNKEYDGTTYGLPSDTTLRRNFIRYINNGGDFGQGYGILLYDGEKRKILKNDNK